MFDALWASMAVPLLQGTLGEDVVHEPGGDQDAAVLVEGVIVNRAGEAERQGFLLESRLGKEILRTFRLELPASVPVTVADEPEGCSTFLIGDDDGSVTLRIWAVRIEGRDTEGGLQTVVCERTEKATSSRAQSRY